MYITSFSNVPEVLCKCYMAQRLEVPDPWTSQSEPSCCVCNMVRLVLGCCCSLPTKSTCSNPYPPPPPSCTYSTPYSASFTCNVNHHQHCSVSLLYYPL